MATDIPENVQTFFSSYPARSFARGGIIIHAEEEPRGVFYVESGRVSQYDIAPNGNVVIVNTFKSGAFFPMSWAINHEPNHFFYEASTGTTVREASAKNTVAFIRENPDVLFDLLSRVYRGTEGMLRRTAHLMGGDAKTRLQFELLNAAYRFGEVQPDGSVFVPLKESDLARHSGLARETINRNLKALKLSGLVEVTRKGFIVPDIAQMETSLGNRV